MQINYFLQIGYCCAKNIISWTLYLRFIYIKFENKIFRKKLFLDMEVVTSSIRKITHDKDNVVVAELLVSMMRSFV